MVAGLQDIGKRMMLDCFLGHIEKQKFCYCMLKYWIIAMDPLDGRRLEEVTSQWYFNYQ